MKKETKDELSEAAILQSAREMLTESGLLTQPEAKTLVTPERCSRIASDGSTRRFWRVSQKDNSPCCLIAAPAGKGQAELAESAAAWNIGNHLRKKGVVVPELFGWDSSTGVLLFEDLGDIRLHDLLAGATKNRQFPSDEPVVAYYRLAIENLAAMQCLGAEGFDQSWCWDSGQYDLQLMVEKESGYFLRAFWQGILGNETEEGVQEELLAIARLAGQAPATFFLHRDFQCRNIMIKEQAVRIIDFQAGRLGPLGYDLASLLIDPYAALSQDVQEALMAKYLQAVGKYVTLEEAIFKKHFTLLAFQRNMQIVGAFSFLYKVRQKPFFLEFIQPSLSSLRVRLEDPLFSDYPLVRAMVNRGLKELTAA